MKISGIYQIQSRAKPERIYIGSAIDLNHRWVCHLYDLRRNKHHSPRLQNHYNKYGEDDLEFSLIITCLNHELIEKEQEQIDLLDPFFNVCPNAGSILGLKRSQSMRDKMKGNKNGAGNKGKTPWNKGRKIQYSPEAIEKMRSANIGNKYGKKNKGKKHTQDTLLKMRTPRSEQGKKNMRGAKARKRIERLAKEGIIQQKLGLSA